MSTDGSVTSWIAELKRGQDAAVQQIWERYVGRLVDVARRRLGTEQRRVADEEDVVALAFQNFWVGMQDGRFSQLEDRHDLWQVLVMLTDRRAADARRKSRTRRRYEVGESALAAQTGPREVAQITRQQPSPEFAQQVVESLRDILDQLEDESLRQVAIWKLEGYTHREIAEKLGCVQRTVERKLKLIRETMSEQ